MRRTYLIIQRSAFPQRITKYGEYKPNEIGKLRKRTTRPVSHCFRPPRNQIIQYSPISEVTEADRQADGEIQDRHLEVNLIREEKVKEGCPGGNPDDYIPQKTFRRVLDKVKSKYNLVLKNPSGGYPNSPHVTYVRNKQPNQRRPRQQRQPVSTAAVKTIKCYICGETTHLADSCPAKKQQTPKVVGAVGVDTADEDPKEDDQPSDEEGDELDTFCSSVSDE